MVAQYCVYAAKTVYLSKFLLASNFWQIKVRAVVMVMLRL